MTMTERQLSSRWQGGAHLEDFLRELVFFEVVFFLVPFLGGGTFAPDARASDRAMAIACLRLFTFFFERPALSVPCFFSCMTFFTVLLALAPYFLLLALLFLLAAMISLNLSACLRLAPTSSGCRSPVAAVWLARGAAPPSA